MSNSPDSPSAILLPSARFNSLSYEQQEVALYEQFATEHTSQEYIAILKPLYRSYHKANGDYFDLRLDTAHLSLDIVPPHCYSNCELMTGYGAKYEITISQVIAFGRNRSIVRNFPSRGHTLFLEDLLLREMVRLFVMTCEGILQEGGYGGYGPHFVRAANRIGTALNLPAVRARRRDRSSNFIPTGANWPWMVRPDGYYYGDIDLTVIVPHYTTVQARLSALPSIYAYFLFLLTTGRQARLQALLERIVDDQRYESEFGLKASERSPLADDGTKLPIPAFDGQWLGWHVQALTGAIRNERNYYLMPILADALEEAGCDSILLLQHCRGQKSHTHDCWALRLIDDTAKQLAVGKPTTTE